MSEFTIKSSSSGQHYAMDWHVPSCKAVVVLVHGLGEHCRRYDHLAAFFNENEIAMLGYDHAGHGQTPGKRGHAKNLSVLMDGVNSMLEEANNRYPGKPIFIYGHSMGGNISLNHILRNRPTIAGAIITGPFIRMVVEPSAILEGIGRILKYIVPSGTQHNGLDAEMISRDSEVVEQYLVDPLVHNRLSFSLGINLLDGARWLNKYKGDSPVPLLTMHGGSDQITSPIASREFASRVTSNIIHEEWEDLYHEIHNEKEQEKVFNFTLDWINERLSTNER